MTTPADVVRIALGEVGYTEGRNNSNKYAPANGQANNQPWCGSFTDWVLRTAGLKGEPSSVWTPAGLQAYRKAGRAIDRNGPAQAGDVVYFDWQGGTGTQGVDHVGIVVQPRLDGQIETVEGNTSPSNAGSQSNGGGVYRRVRPRSSIAGFGRPSYAATPAPPQPTPNTEHSFRQYLAAILQRDLAKNPGVLRQGMRSEGVRALQRTLNAIAGTNLAADAVFGNATHNAVVNFQRFLGLAADGIVGPQTRAMLNLGLQRIERGQA